MASIWERVDRYGKYQDFNDIQEQIEKECNSFCCNVDRDLSVDIAVLYQPLPTQYNHQWSGCFMEGS